jgi:hypothetical protein
MSDLETLAAMLTKKRAAMWGGCSNFPCSRYETCKECETVRVLMALKEHLRSYPRALRALEWVADEDTTSTGHALDLVAAEYLRAAGIHPPLHSAHEALAVVWEEVRELEAEVFKRGDRRSPEAMRKEIVHVAAMAVRFLIDVCLRGEARK